MTKTTLIDLIRAAHLYGFATKYCGRSVRQWVFDQMYTSGKWNPEEKSPELICAVEEYAAGGSVLMLGCGNASMVRHLNPNSFQYLLGIDISPEAISRAGQHANGRVHFEVGDIRDYECDRTFDVILFAESIYYLKADEQASVLKRFCHRLTPKGCIIVTLCNPSGYQDIIQMIRTSFNVLREARFKEADRVLIAFR